MQLVPGLTAVQAKRALHFARLNYKEEEGVTSVKLIQYAKGVQSGLLCQGLQL